MLTSFLAAAVLASTAPAAADAASPAPAAAPEPEVRRIVSPFLAQARLLAALEIDGVEPVEAPEPDDARGRIGARKRNYKTRYRMQERTWGVAIMPGWAQLQGSVISDSFENGFAFTARFIAALSSSNHVYLDIAYSSHTMKNPRPMFFRTAVTPDSNFSGGLTIIAPALFFSFDFPMLGGMRSKPMLYPRTYIGMGPMYTQAQGKVTNSGSKGTVTGHGTQPFVQFTPGLALDYRLPGALEFAFVGLDMRYRISLPTQRPDQTSEFTIPKLYVFEINFIATYYFF